MPKRSAVLRFRVNLKYSRSVLFRKKQNTLLRWNKTFCTVANVRLGAGAIRTVRTQGRYSHAIALRSKRTPPRKAEAGGAGKASWFSWAKRSRWILNTKAITPIRSSRTRSGRRFGTVRRSGRGMNGTQMTQIVMIYAS